MSKIGRSFVSAFAGMTGVNGGVKPNVNIGITERSRRSASIWDNPLGWILEVSKSNEYLSQQLETMLDKNLPDRIVRMVDVDESSGEEVPNKDTDCIKVLLCKTTPFIWSMQNAVSAQMNESNVNELEEPANEDKQDTTADDSRLSPFFKHLPSFDEFKKHGTVCERQFKGCKLF